MSTLKIQDADGTLQYLGVTGSGTSGDPFIISFAGGGSGASVNIAQANGATINVGAGAVGTGTLRTTLASDDPAVASLSVIDDWDESDRCKVNPIAGQVGLQGGAGAASALSLRVCVATDANTVDTELPAAAALSDALANPTTPLIGACGLVFYGGDSLWHRQVAPGTLGDGNAMATGNIVSPWISNGSTFDKQRNNHEVTALSSAARTASVNSSDLTNYNARGIRVVVDITALAGGNITVAITGKDTLSGKYTTLLTGTALSGTGTTTMVIYPGNTVTANLAASTVVPRLFRVEVTAADASSITYSIGVNYIL
jgi:hypothetical protein